ncbi:hypothetical protein CDV55_101466 [Aspergillus turcosus]|nr:hypothetical protein CDV55_101466 [Aspergillus turcosus]
MLFLFGFVLRICIHAVRARKGDDQQNPPLNARYPELGDDSARIRKKNRHIWSKAEQAVRKTAKTKGHARQQPATKKVSPNGEKPRQRDFWASIPHKAGGGIPTITSSRLESRHAQVDLLDYLVRTLGADLSARVPMYTIWDASYSRSNSTIYMKPTTALHAAALGQNEAVTRRLIELGADVNAVDGDGAIPFALCRPQPHNRTSRNPLAIETRQQDRDRGYLHCCSTPQLDTATPNDVRSIVTS